MLQAADLFCGAGGTSTGLLRAAQALHKNVRLVAINHWDMAIATHSENHPGVNHYNSDLEAVNPLKIVPCGRLKLLVASPECTHFSRARGGKPLSKQSRASAKYVLKWMHALDIENVLIENVPDFETWGPLDRRTKRPIPSRKGEYFHRFVNKIRQMGYAVDWRVLNAADYGDPTTRKRLFIIARKKKAVHWPEPSHHKEGGDMFGASPKWRAAREIIDWSIKGESIFHRKKPLAENTVRRIWAGLMKYGGKAFVIGQQSGARPRDVDQPIPTVAGAGAISLIQPFIISMEHAHANGKQVRAVDEPLQTITTKPRFGLIEPFVIPVNHGDDRRTHSIDKPMPTITSVDAWALIEPYIVMLNGTKDDQVERSNRSVDQPLPTVTGYPHFGLVEPFLIPYHTERDGQKPRTYSVDEPIPTIPTNNSFALVEPFLVEYYGTGEVSSVDEPIKTLTGRDRFGLVEPMIFTYQGRKYLLDILFRMLQPHELARAMSFPDGYRFHGTREQVVKQIGNAVPVELATALCKALLED